MKIVHVISSLERGGAQAVLYTLVKAFKHKGHQQWVVYIHGGPYVQEFKQLGITTECIAGYIISWGPVAWIRLSSYLYTIKPDCIHGILWVANWMIRLTEWLIHIPIICSLHNNYDQNGWLRIMLDRCISYDRSHIIAVSQEVKHSFVAAIQYDQSIRVIPNGISLAVDSSVCQRPKYGLTNKHFVVGTVARFVPIKRLYLFIESIWRAFVCNEYIRAVIVGSGPLEDELKRYATQLGVDSIITWIINQPASPYYSLFDCFVLTSEKEGISIALLEAMSHAIVPLVTYHTSKHPVIVHNSNGIITQKQCAQSVAHNIVQLSNDPLRVVRLAQEAQRFIRERYGAQTMIERYDRCFNKICSHSV